MKHLKRFIVLAMVLGIGGILLMRVPATQFRGQDSQELIRHYNLIKAKDINSRTISLYSDDRKVETSGNDQIWMSDDMTLMIPETMVNDLFQCTAARMDGDIIKLIKGQKTCEIDIQKNRVRTDDGWTEARIAEFDRHGNICLSVNYLADYFDYDYQWDDENNTAMLATPEDEPVSLPVRYDLRDYGRVSEVRDQGSWGTCWAFAALSALESSLLPDEKCEFSVDHLAMNNGFNADLDDGGDYNMALAYMASWRGPVTEAQDPYGDGKYEDGLSAAVHLQDAVIINERDYSQLCSRQSIPSRIFVHSAPIIMRKMPLIIIPKVRNATMILILSDGMTPIRKKILLQSRRRTALLSARTAGGPISVRMDFSIYPTKTRILVSMVYPIRVWKMQIIMTGSIRRICLDGRDLLDIMNQWPGFRAFIRRTARTRFGRQVFMPRMQRHIMIFIW